MTFADTFLPEFDSEMQTTRSVLERVPFEQADWRPHPKSTPMGPLASHITNLVGRGPALFNQDELNFAPPGEPPRAPNEYKNTKDLLAAFDQNVATTRAAIAGMREGTLDTAWSLKVGDRTMFTQPRRTVIRTFLMNHVIHHRGQLSVYLRLNDVKLPSIYGPTADT